MVRSTMETAFDAVATDYDRTFTETPLGRLLRRRVWQKLERIFYPGEEVLEVACGTGEDAVWLARRGVEVTATDASAEMVAVARHKLEAAALGDRVVLHQRSLEQIGAGEAPLPPLRDAYNGVFSNFGGLNNTGEWRRLAGALGRLVSRGGRVVLVVMGPVCPWEMAWHLLHGEWRRAFRRLRGVSTAVVGEREVQVWYPSPRRLRRDFSPWFDHLGTESLGLWLPPSYLGHLVARWPGLFARVDGIERATAGFTGGWGDHYITVFERR